MTAAAVAAYGSIADPRAAAYLDSLSARVTPAGERPAQVVLLDTSTPLAFATARGVALSRGFVAMMPTEGALAFVLAHEAAHVRLGHPLGTAAWSESAETDADDEALARLVGGGWDPEEALRQGVLALSAVHAGAGAAERTSYKARLARLARVARPYHSGRGRRPGRGLGPHGGGRLYADAYAFRAFRGAAARGFAGSGGP